MTNLKYDLGMKLKYNLIALFFFGGFLIGFHIKKGVAVWLRPANIGNYL